MVVSIPRSLALMVTVGVGCAGVKGVQPAASPDAGKGRLITAQDIQDTGASNAWDALRYTVRSHYFSSYKGEPRSVRSNRGRGSVLLSEQPIIVLDRARLADLSLLRHVPAGQILSIRVLKGTDGMTYYGTNSTGGVIIITTMLGDRSKTNPNLPR